MFTTEDLQAIDRKYFTVIVADAYDVTLISNNTRHRTVWGAHGLIVPVTIIQNTDGNIIWQNEIQ